MTQVQHSLPQILIVTPPEPDASLLAGLVASGYRVRVIEGTEHALRQVCQEACDVVLLDCNRSADEAMRWLNRIQDSRRPASVIVIGARPSPEEAIRFLRAGAFDFVIQPASVERLLEAVAQAIENRRAFMQIMSLSEQLQSANKRLRAQMHDLKRLAATDSLTNLLNRRAFTSALCREFGKADRYGHSLGLLLIDIDHFKRINDRFGHLAGDSVLRQVSGHLGQTMRTVDVVARFGGEEFAVLVSGAGSGHVFGAAERIRTTVFEQSFLSECRDYRVTVSIGIAQYQGEGGRLSEDLIRDADVALYRAKANGRNRVEVAGFAGMARSPLLQTLQPTMQ